METYKIQIQGRVQGVGFRPYVYQLAQRRGCKGRVRNNEKGVVIYLNETHSGALHFLDELVHAPPKLSVITDTSIAPVATKKFTDFKIEDSLTAAAIHIPLTPDFALCNACKAEISDPKNHRFGYPFTTCISCGPRYAITADYPFERARTTFQNFSLCPTCKKEYQTSNDRRFHSQTNTCPQCGIQLQLVDGEGKTLETIQSQAIKKTVKALRQGAIVAIKNTNGYLLCTDAGNPSAVARLREKKNRPRKPFAVLYPSLEIIEKSFTLSLHEKQTLQSTVAPIVILKTETVEQFTCKSVAPGLRQLGVFLPNSGLLHLLMESFQRPMVATSGNRHGEPIIAQNGVAHEKLHGVADYFLHHNMEIRFPQDDSIVKYAGTVPLLLRRSRGVAPSFLKFALPDAPPALAMGAQLKSAFTWLSQGQIYTSQYFGDLDHFEIYERYQTTLEAFCKLFRTRPQAILVDLHPQYPSTLLGNTWAQKWGLTPVAIQHHKAHFAAVLGEHQLFHSDEKILGVVWDGTGLGEDRQIWGGEFFTYHKKSIERVAHFDYFDWLLQDKMAREPRLSLFCVMEEREREYIRYKFSETEWIAYNALLKKNTLKTSSVGRLFDAVAAALDFTDTNTYEAEAALRLENEAKQAVGQPLTDYLEGEIIENIPSKLLLKKILEAKRARVSKRHIAANFLFTLCKAIIAVAQRQKVRIIACSGGVFQNALLVTMLVELARKNKMILKLNEQLAANDENISFGQLMYAHYLK